MLLLHIHLVAMFLGFVNIKKFSKDQKLLSLSNPSLLSYQPLLFWVKNVPFPIWWRINRTPILIPFVKGEDPAMINQNYFFQIFVTINRASNNYI